MSIKLKYFILLLLFFLHLSCNWNEVSNQDLGGKEVQYTFISSDSIPSVDSNRIALYGDSLKGFAAKKGFNQNFCFLIDMQLHSGVERFFVWDFNLNRITSSGLLSHGCGQNPWCGDASKNNPKFSNEDGSHLSSLGKYRLVKEGKVSLG
jgi:hypothetical protein